MREAIAALLHRRQRDEHLPFAFYGTLMSTEERGSILDHGEQLGTYGSPCRIPGLLWDLGAFPAVTTGPGVVYGQLWYPYEHLCAEATEVMDRIESYYPHDLINSMYLRQRIRLLEPEVDAWCYIWNRPLRAMSLIPDGRWKMRSLSELEPSDA